MTSFKASLATFVAGVLLTGAACAAELKQVAAIPVPGQTLKNFDVGVVDQTTGTYYLADRSNAGVDMFDTATDRYTGRLGTFAGAVMKGGKVDNDHSGPDGVFKVGDELWTGDGDSSIKIFNVATGAVTATLNTGGKTRLDEMAFDPKDHIFIGVNNAEDPPYATLISTAADHKVLGKVVFSDATDGAEQPAYNPADGMFYESIPELGKDPKRGAVAVIDPRTAKLVKMLPVENCHPTGLAFGPDGNFVLGCNASGKQGMPPITVVMHAASGAVVATVAGVGGADMVNYNAHNNQYYTASRLNPGGPVLGVIDAATNKLVQAIAIKGGYPHSVASAEANGQVFLPVGAINGGDATIHVYAPAQ